MFLECRYLFIQTYDIDLKTNLAHVGEDYVKCYSHAYNMQTPVV